MQNSNYDVYMLKLPHDEDLSPLTGPDCVIFPNQRQKTTKQQTTKIEWPFS